MNPIIIEIAPDEVLTNSLCLDQDAEQLFGKDAAHIFADKLAEGLDAAGYEASGPAPHRCLLSAWHGANTPGQIRAGAELLDPTGRSDRNTLADIIDNAEAATQAIVAEWVIGARAWDQGDEDCDKGTV